MVVMSLDTLKGKCYKEIVGIELGQGMFDNYCWILFWARLNILLNDQSLSNTPIGREFFSSAGAEEDCIN